MLTSLATSLSRRNDKIAEIRSHGVGKDVLEQKLAKA
jgi:hypothetical protein